MVLTSCVPNPIRLVSCFLTECVFVCMRLQSQWEDVECPLFQDLFLWLLSSPSQGGVFPISMPVLSISVCQSIQVGVYPLHTRRTFPIFLVISRLFALDLVLSFSHISVVIGISPSLPSPVWHLVFLPHNPERPMKHIISMTPCFIVIVSLSVYSCTGSTGSSWETLPDGRLPVC